VQFVEVLPLPATETSVNRLDHVAFNTADAEGLRRYLGANGVSVAGKVEDASDGSQWFEVRDPEGNRVQFVQPSPKPVDVPLDSLSSHIIHLGYMVRDDKAENVFFRALLGFRPYWFGGRADTPIDWISQQVPDGTDWIEYMMVRDPEKARIPASVTKTSLGTMDHISLGVPSIKTAYEVLYTGDRLNNRNAGGVKIARDGKWQFNMYDADDTRVELMEFQPTVKPCCSPFTASSPTR
jgi:catechol 2,3-dioxygenase-like lactoylglutathione lyase family enzyme